MSISLEGPIRECSTCPVQNTVIISLSWQFRHVTASQEHAKSFVPSISKVTGHVYRLFTNTSQPKEEARQRPT